MVRKEQPIEKEHLRGGDGSVTISHILTEEELMGHGSMYAKVTIHPHSSIGYHQHVGNTEPYYILSGRGIFLDADESRIPVEAGDICTIQPGESHGLLNPYDEPLVIMALVINEG